MSIYLGNNRNKNCIKNIYNKISLTLQSNVAEKVFYVTM